MTGAARQESSARFRSALVSLTVLVLGSTLLLRAWPIYGWFGVSWLPVLMMVILLAVGLVAVVPLGRGALRKCLAGPSRPGWVVLGAVLAVTEYMVVGMAVRHVGQMPSIELMGFVFAVQLVLIGPVIEEFVYRGVMWQACRKVMRPWPAILFTAVVFALYHGPDRLADFPGLFLGGLVLGWLRHRSGSLQPCLVGHSLYNALAISQL